LDVAVACGFKTQQHFAQVFRNIWGVSPTEYRQDLVGAEVTCPLETSSADSPRGVIFASQPELHAHELPFTSLLTSSRARNL
jgi:AraC-like DNA-binding protein